MRQQMVTRRTGVLVISGLVITLLAPVAWAQEARTIEVLAARLKALEDKEAIAGVLIAYGRALDSRDFKTYASLFSRDGSWSGGLGKVTGGPQAIYDFMTSRIGGGGGNAAARPIGFGSTYHIMSSFDIHVTGDTATASSRWAFVSAARGPGIQVAGRYEDTLVRENGVWKIGSRQAFNDLTAPAAAAGAAGASTPGAAPR
jgi:ketosteroid isomerase-like protein